MSIRLPLDAFTLHPLTQARVALNDVAVADYAAVFAAGGSLPDPVVFFDGSTYWLADGHHTYFGAKRAGLDKLVVDLRQGTLRDAILYAVGANAKHGLPRSPADKRKAIGVLLADPEWVTWSNRQIAEAAKVDERMVARCREELQGQPAEVHYGIGHSEPAAEVPPEVQAKAKAIEERGGKARISKTRDGGLRAMDVSKIGKRPAKEAPPEPEPDPDLGEDVGTLLADAQRDVERLTAELKAATADDARAETLKWRQAFDHAQREQSHAMERASQAAEREKWAMRQLQRCGKAVRVDDPTQVAPKVEALARDLAALKTKFKVAA